VRATLMTGEQIHVSVSNSNGDGANSRVGEQFQSWWSKFTGQRAIPMAMEQIQASASNSNRDGANSRVCEQLWELESKL